VELKKKTLELIRITSGRHPNLLSDLDIDSLIIYFSFLFWGRVGGAGVVSRHTPEVLVNVAKSDPTK